MSQSHSLPEDQAGLPALGGTGKAKGTDRTKSEATRRRDDHTEDPKPNIFQRMVIFIREVVAEMKKVTYPTSEELWMYFVIVIIFIAILMAYTGVLDLAFSELSKIVFG